jgi:hypothetical protein
MAISFGKAFTSSFLGRANVNTPSSYLATIPSGLIFSSIVNERLKERIENSLLISFFSVFFSSSFASNEIVNKFFVILN